MTELPRGLYRAEPDPVLGWAARMMNGYVRLLLRGDRVPAPAPASTGIRVRVDRVRAEARDVVSLRLVPVAGGPLPPWQPGHHLDLLLPSGRRRQYSLCGDVRDRSAYRIAVRRIADGGGGSREAHELPEGAELEIRGPRNAFPFVPASRYLFLAGGIGITPILPMVEAAARAGADWHLVYCGRSRASMPFLAELARYGERVRVHADDEQGGPVDLGEQLAAGESVVYCCGPPPMLAAVRAGVPVRRPLYTERFSPPPVTGGQPFEVELRRTGVVLPVGGDETALSVIRAVLPDVGYSCQQGFCGTCRVRVLAGEHGEPHPADQPDEMRICVSRGQDRVSLDL
ncbi:ferredoxin-NADP reductase [Crossiella equi]|uniref:Ferredoxin-NADP reductase n=1 Tax=Crossiella equi TaxID=130796 RepID=A0ABS5AR59_9PSEU|nr:PDR/VanB family oxidoreductase [Crossiella equi]MBP2479030.1 ferredoxin-NADP reductase [Crossiella equi]